MLVGEGEAVLEEPRRCLPLTLQGVGTRQRGLGRRAEIGRAPLGRHFRHACCQLGRARKLAARLAKIDHHGGVQHLCERIGGRIHVLGSRQTLRRLFHPPSVVEHIPAPGVGDRGRSETDRVGHRGTAEEAIEGALGLVEVADEGLRDAQVKLSQATHFLVPVFVGKLRARARVRQTFGKPTARQLAVRIRQPEHNLGAKVAVMLGRPSAAFEEGARLRLRLPDREAADEQQALTEMDEQVGLCTIRRQLG